jgi:hypothetical protein
MCTKYFADGDVHKYFNPYDSPYDSYINFMNVLDHLHGRCAEQTTGGIEDCAPGLNSTGCLSAAAAGNKHPTDP